MEKEKKKFKLNLTDKQKKIALLSGVALLVIIFAVVCVFAFKRDKVEKTEEETNTNTPVETKKLNIIDTSSDSRPIAVMINNHATARKYHCGLQDAYIVYEIIVEGGLTRMMAVFKDADTAKIGSVRSSRHYFLDYAMENDAVYVHYGWSPQAQSDIKTYSINNINGLYDSTFWRDTSLGISTEHTAFTSMEKINATISSKNYRSTSDKKTLLNYSVEDVDLSTKENVKAANSVAIKYSSSVTTSYEYDSTDKVYYRNVNGNKHSDYVTGNQYYAKNIITYQVDNSSIGGDHKGRQDISNVGSGTGYYISEGYAIPIKWSKASREDQTVYTYEDGTEIDVNDGNTFIQIQPTGQTLTIN